MRRLQLLNLQRLESRDVPATFGVPWTDSRHLTLSFAPDQTPISSGKSSLFQNLTAQNPALVWQTEILRAIQSWASVANIDIGLTSDSGIAFGSNSGSGPTRVTGDLRVGAVSMAPTALAVGLPPDPFFGDYWSGEVIYNAANQLNPNQATLYSVFVHEFGHALGLASSSDSVSVMFNHAVTPANGLAAMDITAIQALYGLRQADQYDAEQSNHDFINATNIEAADLPPAFPTYTGQFPLVAFGDMTSLSDIDMFDIETPIGYSGPITFRLQSRGLSLLAPKLTVFNEYGQMLGSSLSTDPGGDKVLVHINQSLPDHHYYLKVEGATEDVFGIGRFGVAVTFDANVQSIYLDRLNSIITGPYSHLDEDDLQELMLNPGQATFNDDSGSDDNLATALPLTAVARLFDAVGTIETTTDTDLYKIRTPDQATAPVLTISARAEAVNGFVPRLELLAANGSVRPTRVLVNGNGRITIQSEPLAPDTDYVVRVRTNSQNQLGNYALTVFAGSTVITPHTFATARDLLQPQTQTLVVVQNQVFHFLLEVNSRPSAGLRVTIQGAQGLVYDLTVYGGAVASNRPILLTTGTYTIQYSPVGLTGVPVTFALRGAVLSDPIGPAANDTTQNPAGPAGSLAEYYFNKLRRFGFIARNEIG